MTVTPPLVAEWDFPSDRIVEILLAALAFSVIISFLIESVTRHGDYITIMRNGLDGV